MTTTKTIPQVFFAQQLQMDHSGAVPKEIISYAELQGALAKIDSEKIKKSNLKISMTDARALISFYNAVIQDGRFIQDFLSKPKEVASKLNIKISDSALKDLQDVFQVVTSPGDGAKPQIFGIDDVAAALAAIIIVEAVVIGCELYNASGHSNTGTSGNTGTDGGGDNGDGGGSDQAEVVRRTARDFSGPGEGNDTGIDWGSIIRAIYIDGAGKITTNPPGPPNS